MDENFDIPLLNNIDDALSVANTELQSYFDLLRDENVHYAYSIKHVIINLSTCIELLTNCPQTLYFTSYLQKVL